MKSNSFSCSHLQFGRDGVALAAPVSFNLQAGEMLVVQGANGVGKSTLLKTLAGLLLPLAGHFHHSPQEHRLYLGHRHAMLGAATVAANVTYWARAAGVPELAAAALHYFDLDMYHDMEVDKLSAGWQQRVSLTRLITMPASLWLLDEPSANLDRDGMNLLQSLLQSRLEQGGIAILSSHAPISGASVKTLELTPSEQEIKELI